MVSIYDVDSKELIEKVAVKLKDILDKPPEWSKFVKTGMHKERPPVKKDWWYMRSASILRQVYIKGPIGVQKLRRKYGGRKNRGMKPEIFCRGSGNILRKVFQQLEKANLVQYKKEGINKGRIITPKGKSLLDKTAGEIKKCKK